MCIDFRRLKTVVFVIWWKDFPANAEARGNVLSPRVHSLEEAVTEQIKMIGQVLCMLMK